MTSIFHNAPPLQPEGSWIAIDLEISKADKKKLHRPTTGEFALCTFYDGANDFSYVVHDPKQIPVALHNVKDSVWIFHNAKFDLTHLRRWAHIPPRNKIWDTFLIEKILWGGYYDEFALDDLARRYLDIKLDKSLQKAWEKATEITPEMLEYAVMDSKVDYQICMEQRKLVKQSHWKVWKEIDLPAMWAVMDFQGFRMDVERWKAFAIANREKSDAIDAELPFNPRSPKVVRAALSKAGFKGLPSTEEDILERWLERYPNTEAARLTQMILDSRMYRKRASTYGINFVDKFLEDEGGGVYTVTCSYNVIGAETGRMSAKDPPMQTIPIRETPEFRESFIARPGHKLVIIDFSQQEIVVLAYVSQDEALIAICNSGGDIYICMAKIMYDMDIDKKHPIRKQMKSVVLGANYGMSAIGLAKKEKITEEAAETALRKLQSSFPGVSAYMRRQEKIRSKVYTVAGRTVHLNAYSSQCPRNALNGPIQGTAADMYKKWLGELHKQWNSHFKFPFAVVAAVHDEGVLDVPEEYANDVAEFATNLAAEVANKMCPGMNFKLSCSIGSTWAEK